MESIGGYRSENEQDSDSEYKSRDSVQSNNGQNSGSSSKKTQRGYSESYRHSPDRRRRDHKTSFTHLDRTSSQQSKSSRRDRSAEACDRPKKNSDRSRNESDRPRGYSDRARETRGRKCGSRTRDEKRYDHQSDGHDNLRAHRGRSDRNKRHWRSRSNSRNRYTNPESPCDKNDKLRKRCTAQRTSSQDRTSNLPSTKPSSQSHVFNKHPNKSSRGYERQSEAKTHDCSSTAPKDTLYQPLVNAPATNDLGASHQEKTSDQPSMLPSYYNPQVINPNKYAEQVQKRKLLWGNKKVEDTASKWGNAKFAQDTDGKVASKFMRLMGIKDQPKAADVTIPSAVGPIGSESIKKQQEMFSSMEQQYEVARQATHTMRGVGLGFSSQSRPF